MLQLVEATQSKPQRSLFEKVKYRLLYYYGPGSPLRVANKISLYSKRMPEFLKRRSIANSFKNESELTAVLTALEANGYCDVTALLDKNAISQLITAAHAQLANPEASRGAIKARYFFSQLLSKNDLTADSVWLKVALQEKLIKIASLYFGQVPQMFSVALLHSTTNNGKPWEESQLWHRDSDDTRNLKLFVYATDVPDANAGPFTFLPLPTSAKVRDRFVKTRMTDGEMSSQIDVTRSQVQLTGKAGTAFLVDAARCYHLGSRCMNRDRLAYVAAFNSIAPLFPDPRHLEDLAEAESLTPLQRMALKI